ASAARSCSASSAAAGRRFPASKRPRTRTAPVGRVRLMTALLEKRGDVGGASGGDSPRTRTRPFWSPSHTPLPSGRPPETGRRIFPGRGAGQLLPVEPGGGAEAGMAEIGATEWLRRVRAGERAAAAELVRRYEPQIRLEVRLRLRDRRLRRLFDSTDICQSVL